MINRIEAGYNEIIKWKKRFDKLFSSEVTGSRAFKLEQLAMYERLLRQHKGLNRDEKVFRKLVGQEKKSIERSLYPNPLIRVVRKAIVLGISAFQLGKKLFSATRSNQDRQLREDMLRAGFGELSTQMQRRLAQGEPSFKLEQSESLNEKERLNYSLIVSQNDKGVPAMESFEVKHINENGQSSNFRFDASSGINKEQAKELVSGRAINANGNNWKMIDFNDKDAAGNFLVRELSIPDFDIVKELNKLSLRRSTQDNAEALLNGLRAGKKMACSMMVDGKLRSLEIEAQPLKRGFQLYENGNKISLAKAVGKGQERNGQMPKLRVAHSKQGIGSKVK